MNKLKFVKIKVVKNPDIHCYSCDSKATTFNDCGEACCKKCLKEYIEWGNEIKSDIK